MNIGYSTKREITIIGQWDEREEAHAFCKRNGYHITWSGPLLLTPWKADPARFKFIAEKKLK